MKDKEYWRKELENVDTLYIVGIAKGTNPRWDRGIWRKFRVYYIKNGELVQVYIEGDDYPPYWVPRHQTKSGKWVGGYFECGGLGTDRTFEIAYALKRWLGFRKDFRVVFLSYL